MTFVPDIADYQQLAEPITGNVDCTAYAAALLAAVHSGGRYQPTGREVRLASNEPVPDPKSPGLNLPQVDDAVRKLTAGAIDLDGTPVSVAEAQRRIVAGRWGEIQVVRSVLVDAGLGGGSKFGGGHAITAHTDPAGVLLDGDPLVPHYMPMAWSDLWAAATAFTRSIGTTGVYALWTRDVTVSYRAVIHPAPPATRKPFWIYELDRATGLITGRSRHWTRGMSAACTPPAPHSWPGIGTRQLVKLTSGGLRGEWVDARYAIEVP